MAILRKWLLFDGNENIIISNNEENETNVVDDQPRILFVEEIPLEMCRIEIDNIAKVCFIISRV